ncbi:MAG: DUF6089 family protein [Flavobacteriales bacterium]|nr:DUF6089 family protein [Flavobacteriales bacterium]|tara:strand:- start:119 stop:895 length:777 start_codon:yes stop_codon:yes gene_type:complete
MKGLFFHIFFFISISILQAQTPTSSWELGAFGGDSYYLGETNQKHIFPLNLAFGPFLRYNYDERLSLKAALTIGKIEGNDASSRNSFNKDRNFSFTSQIIEGSIIGEFNFFSFSALDPNSYLATPYFFIGAAFTNHNPKANFNGIPISTANLQTEGKAFSKNIFVIPLGVGIKTRFNNWGVGLNWGIRKTFTDYMDDISTNYIPEASTTSESQASIANTTQYSNVDHIKRGDRYNKDWYVFTGLTIFVNLTPEEVCRK